MGMHADPSKSATSIPLAPYWRVFGGCVASPFALTKAPCLSHKLRDLGEVELNFGSLSAAQLPAGASLLTDNAHRRATKPALCGSAAGRTRRFIRWRREQPVLRALRATYTGFWYFTIPPDRRIIDYENAALTFVNETLRKNRSLLEGPYPSWKAREGDRVCPARGSRCTLTRTT